MEEEKKLSLIIKTSFERFTIKLGENSKIRTLKSLIKDHSGISICPEIQDQILYYNDLELDDANKISLYNLPPNAEILLVIKKIKKDSIIDKKISSELELELFVLYLKHMGSGERLKYFVSKNMSVQNLQLKIQDEEGIDVQFQKLIFNNIELQSQYTLAYYNIYSDSVLNFIHTNIPFLIQIALKEKEHNVQNKKISLSVVEDTTVEQLLFQLQEKLEKEQKKDEEHKYNYGLCFQGKFLNSAEKIECCKHADGTFLAFPLQNQFVIMVKDNYSSSTFLCHKDLEIMDLKGKVEEIFKIPSNQQKLMYNDKELSSQNQLVDYQIASHDTIILIHCLDHLEINLKIIKQEGIERIITLDLLATSTIGDIKTTLELEERLPIEEQDLFFQNQFLEEDKTLQFYAITNRATIVVFIQKFTLIIELPHKEVTFTVKPDFSLLKIKRQLSKYEKIGMKEMIVIVENHPILNDRKSLHELNIGSNGRIKMLLRKQSMLFLKHNITCKAIEMDLESVKLSDLKKMDIITELLGERESENAIIKHKNGILSEEGKVLEDYGIKDLDFLTIYTSNTSTTANLSTLSEPKEECKYSKPVQESKEQEEEKKNINVRTQEQQNVKENTDNLANGLNFQFYCPNTECLLYNENKIKHLGDNRNWNVLSLQKSSCEACGKAIKCKALFILNSFYLIYGREKGVPKFNTGFKQATNQHVVFDKFEQQQKPVKRMGWFSSSNKWLSLHAILAKEQDIIQNDIQLYLFNNLY